MIEGELGRACPDCPLHVPIVANFIARDVVERVRALGSNRCYEILERAAGWLVQKHEGLTIYEGINGRPYTPQEKDAIGGETGFAAASACPFAKADATCGLGGLCNEVEWFHNASRRAYIFLPSALMLGLAPDAYREMVRAHRVADAKVGWLTRNAQLPATHVWDQDGAFVVPHEAGLTWVENPTKKEADPELAQRQETALAYRTE